MNYEIIRKLAEGFFSEVYLIKNLDNNKKCVLKIQKILESNQNEDFKYEIWREIDFSLFVNKLPKSKKKFFIEMYDYKIDNNCKEVSKSFLKSYNLNKKKLKKLFESEYCLKIIYELRKYSLYDLLKKNNISLNEKYSFLVQIFYALDIMKKNGYTHNDLHTHNIMYEKSNDYIKIRNKKFKSKYQYSLIDYGFVNHKKYSLKKKDNVQLIIFLQNLNRENIIIDIYRENNWKLKKEVTDPLKMYYFLLEMYKYKDIWNKIKEKLLKILPNSFKFYDFFENNLNLKKISEYLWNNDSDNIDIYIKTLFLAYDSKKYYEILGLNKVKKKNLIPGNDIEFIILNLSNYKKLISYFLKKLN
jgi:serine/threonine protein kinase